MPSQQWSKSSIQAPRGSRVSGGSACLLQMKERPLVSAAICALRTWIKFLALTDTFCPLGAIYVGSEEPLGVWTSAP